MSETQDIIPYDERGGSFWEINGYKRTSKRVSDGYSLCSELMTLVRERAELENKYSSSLRSWAKKWRDIVGKGPEYGTTEASWEGMLTEADRLSDLHNTMRDNLINGVHMKAKQWQKETYSKQKLGGLKQHKELDEGFSKAQKPWAKKYEKVVKSRDEYHKACKALRTAEITERNQQPDTSIPDDQKRKNVLKIEEWTKKQDASRTKYEACLQDISDYNARYMEDMSEVFRACQNLEEKRQDFFKELMFDMHQCLNLSTNPEYSQVYNDLHSTIANADSQKDLKWWAQTNGVDMAMNWPAFEEFMPNQANLSKKSVRKPVVDDGGITLTMIKKDQPKPQPHQPPPNNQRYNDPNNAYMDDSPPSHSPALQRPSLNRRASYEPALNPFADPDDGQDLSDYDDDADPSDGDQNPFAADDDEGDDYLVDDGRPGVGIRALYDYIGDEDDELNFKAGDEFEKLEEEDEQGWCKGRLNGKVGLYPANFCVEI